MKITTVRHGQTLWNHERRIQGQSDIELDDVGLSQAEKLGNRLATEKIDIIYTSNLKRAVKTAEIINNHHNAKFVTVTALREMCYGTYEGCVFDNFQNELDYYYQNINTPMPEGESVMNVFDRIYGFLDEVVEKQYENIVIVSHYGVILTIICYLLQVPPEERERFMINNTAIHCFERKSTGKFNMTIENDISHLDYIT